MLQRHDFTFTESFLYCNIQKGQFLPCREGQITSKTEKIQWCANARTFKKTSLIKTTFFSKNKENLVLVAKLIFSFPPMVYPLWLVANCFSDWKPTSLVTLGQAKSGVFVCYKLVEFCYRKFTSTKYLIHFQKKTNKFKALQWIEKDKDLNKIYMSLTI